MPQRSLAGRHILLTGVTGFVGKVWLALVLQYAPDIGRVTCIVRPRGRKQTGRRRLERILDTSPAMRPLRGIHGADFGRFLGSRIDVMDGDVEKPLFGLTTEQVASLTGSVDLVLHCAGITDFDPDPLKALRININGARHAAQLSRRLGAPLLHVSTCFVAGNISGTVHESLEPGLSPNGTRFDVKQEIRELHRVCREGEGAEVVSVRAEAARARALRLGWPNLYTYSKGLAEHVVATLKDVDWTIVRPSIVECARNFPFAGWNEGLNTAGPLAWLISTPFRNLPTRPENLFDIVPVDDVARGLAVIAGRAIRGEAGGVWHLASSDANPLRFGRTVELTGLAMRRWTRKGGGSAVDKALIRHLDPVPVPQDAQGLLAPSTLRPVVKRVRSVLGRFDAQTHLPPAMTGSGLADTLTDWAARAGAKAAELDSSLGQVEGMLALFKPFIHDNDYCFRTDRIRAAAPSGDPDFGWGVPTIDWRSYWVDVEYPGLQTWSIPMIRGEAIPTDPPSTPPLRIQDVLLQERAASK